MRTYLLLGLVVALASVTFAYPTLTGPTGLATLPTAAVAPAGQIDLAADYYNTSKGPVENTFPARVTLGVVDSWEIGAAYLFQKNANTWDLNTKFATPLNLGGFGIAVGAQYAQADLTGPNDTISQVYVSAGRTLTTGNETVPGIGLTLGANWTKDKLIDNSAIRGYVGLEAALMNNLSLNAEYQTKSNKLEGDALWSVAGRLAMSQTLGFQVGWTNGPFFGGADHNLFAGVDLAWGMMAK